MQAAPHPPRLLVGCELGRQKKPLLNYAALVLFVSPTPKSPSSPSSIISSQVWGPRFMELNFIKYFISQHVCKRVISFSGDAFFPDRFCL